MRAVIGIVVLVGLGWLTVKARGTFRQGAHRHVLARQRHADGQHLTRETLVIRSSLDAATLQDAVVRGLGLPYEKPVTTRAELFQGPVSPGHAQFCSGTTAMTAFTAAVRLEPDDEGGSTLTYGVERWTLADGVVAGIPQLRFLRRRVEEEARKVDPDIAVTVRTAPARAAR